VRRGGREARRRGGAAPEDRGVRRSEKQTRRLLLTRLSAKPDDRALHFATRSRIGFIANRFVERRQRGRIARVAQGARDVTAMVCVRGTLQDRHNFRSRSLGR
jgi:hypothetical protein